MPWADPPNRLPFALRLVAVLFILSGMDAALKMVFALLAGMLKLDVGLLGIWIGLGLMRRHPAARTWALVYLWLAGLASLAVTALFVSRGGPFEFRIFGVLVGHVPLSVALATAGLLLVLLIWQYRVLKRSDVRRIFTAPPATPPHPLFVEFLSQHPHFRTAHPRLQRAAYHRWLNNPLLRTPPASTPPGAPVDQGT